MGIKQKLLVTVAVLNTACAGVLVGGREPLPSVEDVPLPDAEAASEASGQDALCTPAIAKAAREMADSADPIGSAHDEGRQTVVVYEVKRDAEFQQVYGAQADKVAARYDIILQQTMAMISEHADVRFVRASDDQTIKTLEDVERVDVKFSGKAPDDRYGDNEKPWLGRDTATLYVPNLEKAAPRAPNDREQTTMHEMMHALGMDKHVDEIFPDVKAYEYEKGKWAHEFSGVVQPETTSLTKGLSTEYDKMPELDLCALRDMYGAPPKPSWESRVKDRGDDEVER